MNPTEERSLKMVQALLYENIFGEFRYTQRHFQSDVETYCTRKAVQTLESHI